MAEVQEATAAEVRAWARKRGIPVGNRGHIDRVVIGAFNRAHRVKQFTSKNPSDGYQPPKPSDRFVEVGDE